MTRRRLRVVTTKYLLVGVLLTIMSSWLIALTAPLLSVGPGLRQSPIKEGRRWYWRTDQDLGRGISELFVSQAPVSYAQSHGRYGPWWSRSSNSPSSNEPSRRRVLRETATGFPLLAMRSTTSSPVDDEPLSPEDPSYIWAIPTHGAFDKLTGRLNSSIPRSLPLQPLWRGFVVNIIFWMATIAVLDSATTILMRIPWTREAARRKRHSRGICLKRGCGYDTTGLDICPECGTPTSLDGPHRETGTPDPP